MTAASTSRSRGTGEKTRRAIRILKSRRTLWAAFILVHLWLCYLNFTQSGLPLGDVTIQYRYWAQQADTSAFYYGIDGPWVYPIVALVPMIAAGIFGFAGYDITWLEIVCVLDLIAFGVMVGIRSSSRSVVIGWWWLGFLVLLGPIALGRIDSISVPLAIVGVLLLASRPRIATILLTIATWIKVWPAAIIFAAVIASKKRISVALTAVITSAVIIAIALALGAGDNVFSFVSKQTSRGLQVESPVSSIWMWMSFAHVPGAFVYYASAINTFEVTGPNAATVAALMNPLFVVVVIVVAVLGIVAAQRGAAASELLAPLSLALVTAFISFNKVGSPQYMTWIAVPIILGLATRVLGYGRSFQFPATIALVAAGLTQVMYPVLYLQLLYLQLPLLIVLTARNILVLVLFGWSVVILVDLARPFVAHEELTGEDAWLPAAWPFALRPTHDPEEEPAEAQPTRSPIARSHAHKNPDEETKAP
jgi:hypothetical protein